MEKVDDLGQKKLLFDVLRAKWNNEAKPLVQQKMSELLKKLGVSMPEKRVSSLLIFLPELRPD